MVRSTLSCSSLGRFAAGWVLALALAGLARPALRVVLAAQAPFSAGLARLSADEGRDVTEEVRPAEEAPPPSSGSEERAADADSDSVSAATYDATGAHRLVPWSVRSGHQLSPLGSYSASGVFRPPRA